MPMIQIDLQQLNDEQRAELRTRAVAAVSNAIGSPYPYVSLVIRESEPANIVEAGGWGPYDARQLLEEAHGPAAPDGPAAAEANVERTGDGRGRG
jgi:phenylpyruvate tautomerase PptA (4-oxalocrotonate tautomerase family)